MVDAVVDWESFFRYKRERRRVKRLLGRGNLGEWTGKSCPYCRRIMTNLGGPNDDRAPSRDHRIARSRGGRNTIENIDVVCAGCNNAKDNMMAEEFSRLRPRLF
jgi:5-methylcytosine-specific restriction endonuclease McrA